MAFQQLRLDLSVLLSFMSNSNNSALLSKLEKLFYFKLLLNFLYKNKIMGHIYGRPEINHNSCIVPNTRIRLHSLVIFKNVTAIFFHFIDFLRPWTKDFNIPLFCNGFLFNQNIIHDLCTKLINEKYIRSIKTLI